ncbi:MAG: hypothetical protein IPJ67_01850 [Candidatus Moraniibacteriota bacterium]|nr:MAG: hypothetical protein IPJ67_01850 [Candidatus Moranbacteria bacterium]
MAEEPILNEEWSEENDVPTKSLMDRVRELRSNFQKRLAEGSVLTFVLLFVFGIFFGIAAKAVASRSILIGYWDYTITPQEKAAVNLNAVQQRLATRQEEEAKSQKESAAPATDDASGADASNGDAPEGKLPPLPPTPEPPASPDTAQE